MLIKNENRQNKNILSRLREDERSVLYVNANMKNTSVKEKN